MQIDVIKKGSKDYPAKLAHLSSPPRQFSQLGRPLIEQLEGPVLGIVGSRKVSAYGRAITERFAEAAAKAGVCVVSGLALGVDSIAHAAAIHARGRTVAVMPSGLKKIYPAAHRNLAKNILEKNGTLISEYPDDSLPARQSFIERNRLIAALSDALLVTEAAEKSGSLHTARFALELGRPVLAVPGNITSATSAGTNNLLKAGAGLITSEQDLFEILKIEARSAQTELFGDTEEETILINLMDSGVLSGDELLSESDLDTQIFQQTLTMLEIKGVITPLGNNNWKLK